MADTTLYQRLPGRAMRSFGFAMERERLYMGTDHILVVQQHGYTEKSKRFFFKDIQMIALHETPWMGRLNMIIGLAWLLFMVLALAIGGSDSWTGFVFGVFFTVVFLGCFLINTAIGPTAATYISSRVQTYRISSLGRLRTARTVVARIEQEIDRVQEMPARHAAEPEPATPEPAPEPVVPETTEQ